MNENVELQQKRKANEDFLSNQMFYAGFGEIPKSELVKQLAADKDDFQLHLDKKMGKDSVRAVLNFKKSDKDASMYFFNSFDLLLKKEGKEETLQRNFSTYYGNSYTLKEAYNMLDGRAIGKNFVWTDRNDKTNKKEEFAWEELDFISLDDRGNFKTNRYYDFDVEKVVEGFPIKGLEFEKSKESLVNSLKKGNRVAVMFITSKGEKLVHIEADPMKNTLNLYNDKLEKITLSGKEKLTDQELIKSMENSPNNNQPDKNTETDQVVTNEKQSSDNISPEQKQEVGVVTESKKETSGKSEKAKTTQAQKEAGSTKKQTNRTRIR